MKVYQYIIRIKDQASAPLNRFKSMLNSAGSGLRSFASQVTGFGGQLKSLGNNFLELTGLSGALARTLGTAAIVAGLGAMSAKAVTLAADLEQTTVGFEVMLGSAEKANKMITDLRQFAKVTPFETTDLVRAAETMMGFGIAGEKIMPTISMLGDVARGSSEKLRLISLAYSQIQAAGRLMGQDLLQLINAGFNPLQEMAQKMAKSLGGDPAKYMPILKKQMEEGAISAQMVTDAFVSATSEGGRFFGMMERQSKTFHGMVSTLRDEWNEGLTELGEKILPKAIEGVKGLRSILSDLTNRVDFSPLLMAMSDTWDKIREGAGLVKQLFDLVGINVNQVNLLQFAFNALAFSLRTGFAPLRVTITGIKLLVELIGSSIGVLKGFGAVMVGIWTRNFSLIQSGWEQTTSSFKQGFNNITSQITDFAKSEYEGYKAIFNTGPKPGAAATAMNFGTASSLTDRGADKKTKNGLDKISGGGRSHVNVTINLDNLIGVQNFDVKNIKESMRDMETMAVEALLRVLNSANYAANQ